jgi:hypothetical protein
MAFRKFVKKTVRKGVSKAVTAVKKRYFKGGKVSIGNAKLAQMARDVAMLKLEVNAEKKRIDDENETPIVVQQTGTGLATSGYYVERELFIIPEGTGHREKNGNSIKCNSYHIDLKITNLSSPNGFRGKIFLVRLKEPQFFLSNDDIIRRFLTLSAFADRYDYNSPRNYENMNDFQVVGYKNVSFPVDSITGQNPDKILQIGGKLNFHQRTKEVAGVATSYDTNELCLIMVADRGGGGAGDQMGVQWKGTLYFYDN